MNDKPGCSLTLPPHLGSTQAARLSNCLENTQCCQVDELLLCQGTDSRATPGRGSRPVSVPGGWRGPGDSGPHLQRGAPRTHSITGLTLCGAPARAASSSPKADLRAGAGLPRNRGRFMGLGLGSPALLGLSDPNRPRFWRPGSVRMLPVFLGQRSKCLLELKPPLTSQIPVRPSK